LKVIKISLFYILFSSFLVADEENIRNILENILPKDAQIESIEKSPIKGIYSVYYGDSQPLYISENGEFILYGDLLQINNNYIINLTEESVKKRRSSILQSIPSNELISFKSINEIYSIIVFTDVDCAYCRKLHKDIDEYNKLGITVNYAAFPRSGLGTSSFTKMVGAWCSRNPKDSITKLKNNQNLSLTFCDSQPVSRQFIIGKKLGVNGTPAIFSSDGIFFPGYVEPQELLSRLKS
jgi:thiol:disulfide interchange protein DsbC